MTNLEFEFGQDVYVGGTEYRFRGFFAQSRSDHTAVVLYRPSDHSYAVGKNVKQTGPHSLEWCWGAYDFKDIEDAYAVAKAWVFD